MSRLPFLAVLRRPFPLLGTPAPAGVRRAARGRPLRAALWLLMLASPLAPAQAADSQRGAGLYASHCVLCHGERGAPTWPGAPDLRRAATLMKTDAQVLTTLRYGRGAMPAYLGVLKDRDLLDVTAHLRTLAR